MFLLFALKLTFETHTFAESAPIKTFTAMFILQFVGFIGLNCRKESLPLDAIIPSSTEIFSVSEFLSEGVNPGLYFAVSRKSHCGLVK